LGKELLRSPRIKRNAFALRRGGRGRRASTVKRNDGDRKISSDVGNVSLRRNGETHEENQKVPVEKSGERKGIVLRGICVSTRKTPMLVVGVRREQYRGWGEETTAEVSPVWKKIYS